MKNWIAFTILFMMTCLTSSAQFKLLLKGDPSPYDSSVSVEITQYRALRFKLVTSEQYITSLNTEIDSLRAQVRAQQLLAQGLTALSNKQNEFLAVNQNSFADLNRKFDDLLIEATKPKKWYKQTWIYVTMGAAGVYILTR